MRRDIGWEMGLGLAIDGFRLLIWQGVISRLGMKMGECRWFSMGRSIIIGN